jgi:hypothetical protein
MKEQDWDIKSRSDACMQCERKFEDQEAFWSRLTFEDQGYTRMDFCGECWEKTDDRGISRWKTVYRMPAPPPEEPLKKETAESLLRKLIEDEDPAHLNTRYILAVMLERRRILVEKDVNKHDDGTLVRVYEHKKTGEVFLIPDPQLRLSELEQVQEEVVAMLGGDSGGEGDAGSPSPPEPEAEVSPEETDRSNDGVQKHPPSAP